MEGKISLPLKSICIIDGKVTLDLLRVDLEELKIIHYITNLIINPGKIINSYNFIALEQRLETELFTKRNPPSKKKKGIKKELDLEIDKLVCNIS